MALFARRHLQRVLNENAVFLSPKQLSVICDLLNTIRDDYLATEWEQVIINTASKVGAVLYEARLAGNRTPADVLVRDLSAVRRCQSLNVDDRGGRERNKYDRNSRDRGEM